MKMKAMLIEETSRELVWSDVEKPSAGAGQVVIEIYAAALNRADLLQRAGTYPSPKGWPAWMGLEVSGVVSEVGENVARWKVGDKVCQLCLERTESLDFVEVTDLRKTSRGEHGYGSTGK